MDKNWVMAVALSAAAFGISCTADQADSSGGSGGGAGSDTTNNGGSGAGGSGGNAGAGGNGGMGSGAGGSAGISSSGAGGSGGSTGDSGASGSAGMSSSVTLGRDPNAVFDATLGGFNQDLPEPTAACTAMEPMVFGGGCFAISGTYNGEAFNLNCWDDLGGPPSITTRTGTCFRPLEAGDSLIVQVTIGVQTAPNAPAAFEVTWPEDDVGDIFVRVSRSARTFDTHSDSVEPLTVSHDLEMRLAGELWWEHPYETGPIKEIMFTTFALSYTPKADCTRDAEEFGCDEIRLRGVLFTETLQALEP
jgi:hypothetical protein